MMPPGSLIDGLEFYYEQSTGFFGLADSEDGRAIIARGYSGKGVGLNDPSFEDRIAEGPIPSGVWNLGPPIHHARLGALSIPLARVGPWPIARSGFYIHGDNQKQNFSASTGCIILNRRSREFIDILRRAGVDRLSVIA